MELRGRFQRLVLTEVITAQTLGDFGRGGPHETTGVVRSLCNGVADWFGIEGAAAPEQIADRYVDFALRLILDRDSVGDPGPDGHEMRCCSTFLRSERVCWRLPGERLALDRLDQVPLRTD